MPSVSIRNHFSYNTFSGGTMHVIGEVRVVPEIVDLVVAGHPPPDEGQRAGKAALPPGLGGRRAGT